MLLCCVALLGVHDFAYLGSGGAENFPVEEIMVHDEFEWLIVVVLITSLHVLASKNTVWCIS